jgi:hypothetical protein
MVAIGWLLWLLAIFLHVLVALWQFSVQPQVYQDCPDATLLLLLGQDNVVQFDVPASSHTWYH